MKLTPLSLASLLMLAGCATAQVSEATRHSASARKAVDEQLTPFVGRSRASANSARPDRDEVPTAETASPRLAAALARLKATPTSENHRLAGDAYREAQIPDQAFDHYSLAARIAPDNAGAWDGMARIWRDWGFAHLALADAHRAVHYAADSASAHNTLGTILDALGQRHLARRHYERALALEPDAAYASNNLCYSWVLDGQPRQAARACQAALAASPSSATAANNLGLAHAAAGDVAQARADFAAAGDPGAAAYNTGVVFQATGHDQEAATAFQSAAVLAPRLLLVASAHARAARERAARRDQGDLR